MEDGVTTVDIGPLCRKLGLAWLMTNPYLWCVKDICGWVCAIFTWLLVLYAEYVVNFVMLLHNPNTTWSIINGVIFQFFAFMAIASHLRCMLSDPVSISQTILHYLIFIKSLLISWWGSCTCNMSWKFSKLYMYETDSKFLQVFILNIYFFFLMQVCSFKNIVIILWIQYSGY